MKISASRRSVATDCGDIPTQGLHFFGSGQQDQAASGLATIVSSFVLSNCEQTATDHFLMLTRHGEAGMLLMQLEVESRCEGEYEDEYKGRSYT